MITVMMTLISAFLIVLLFKNSNTYKNHRIIGGAIYAFRVEKIKNHKFDEMDLVTYDDAEDYEKTLLRLWDWGYTRILPKEKFELIKPYIKKGSD